MNNIYKDIFKKEDLDFTKKVIALEYSAEDEKIILKELN